MGEISISELLKNALISSGECEGSVRGGTTVHAHMCLLCIQEYCVGDFAKRDFSGKIRILPHTHRKLLVFVPFRENLSSLSMHCYLSVKGCCAKTKRQSGNLIWNL